MVSASTQSAAGRWTPLDRRGRPLGVLRLSLTARCNLACPYCLPDGVEPPGLLTLPQRLRVIEAAVALGARNLRLTGGEPLLHGGLEELIAAVQQRLAGREREPQHPQGAVELVGGAGHGGHAMAAGRMLAVAFGHGRLRR